MGPLAMHLETEGLPRMAGRVFIHLLVCEPPERTAADLARELHASAGSISAMTRLLERAGLIERVARAGERADRFRVTPEQLATLIDGAGARIRRFRELTEELLEVIADRPPAMRTRLERVHGFYAFMEKRLPALIQEWRREQGAWP
jgi:DNA-binding transcriptional regulator GbsR (MarR family)